MRMRFSTAVALATMLLGASCASMRPQAVPGRGGDRTEQIRAALDSSQPRNVILMIGDGLGDDEIAMARNYHAGAAGRMNFERLPFAGEITTWAIEEENPDLPDYVPDSASTATAWSTGRKTSDRRISTSAQADRPLATIIELAQKKGLRVGNVTTADITDATPACAAAHVSHRKCAGPELMEKCPQHSKANGGLGSIAEQLVDHKIDVLLGGGRKTLGQRIDAGPHAGRTVLESARLQGYRVVERASELAAIRSLDGGPILGLFADEHFTPQWTGERAAPYPCSGPQTCVTGQAPPEQPSLPAMTRKALELLENDAGFFVQIEGAIIDRCAHAADPCGQIGDTIDFDEAVAVAVDYAAARGDTLVIVTADHAQGSQIVDWLDDENHTLGLCSRLTTREGAEMRIVYGTNLATRIQQHTGATVRIAAQGPRAANVLGINEQTELFFIIAAALGLGGSAD
jgi:alkaline phosphatase/streptomycin-6-phosphatase